MDSREMYNATNHLTPLITWDKDWIHFGTENEIMLDSVEKIIEDHLSDKNLLFIHERTTSRQYERKEIIDIIKPILGKENFQLWTISMDKAIQFNRIGVLHLGQKKGNGE
ncbi:MAG: hypothetical protein WKF87_03900 [Chryseolinea sp.]